MADIDLIRRNIGKMLDQDAPEADIDAYLASEGVSTDQLKRPSADPIRATVRSELEAERAKGVPAPSALQRLGMQGATFNTSDEILAAAATPIEMFRRGTWSPVEGYNYAKAREDLELEEARKNTGALGTVAEVGGGILSGSGLARAGMTLMPRVLSGSGLARAGMTLMPRAATASLPARIGGLAADSAIMGGVAGAAGASGSDRLTEGAKGAAIGGVAGGAIGAVAPVVSALGRNTMGWMRATANPESYARSQLARALMESGRSPDDIARAVSDAAADGQPYAVADALGNPGQRMLSSVTRAPGAGRTAAVDFLEQRQAGQGRRVANALAEGLESPHTAAQTRTAMTEARDTAADAAYGSVRGGATPVDLSRTIARIDETLRPGVNQVTNPGSGIADDSVESALARVRSRLTDGRSTLTEFEAVHRARGDLADAIERARRAGEGNKVRLLSQVRAEMDAALEAASPGFRQANAQFRDASRVIDAVDEGSAAAQRGRSEDIIPDFRHRPAPQQDAFRAGYADRLIGDAQGAAVGANKARPLTSDAYQNELPAIAPMRYGNQMMRRLDRENEMFATRNHALGGSRTADNLADADSLGASPEIIANLLSGRVLTAGQNMLARSTGALSGNTPAVRERLAQALLATGQAPDLQAMLNEAVQSEEMRRMILAAALRGVTGGGAVALPATGVTNTRR